MACGILVPRPGIKPAPSAVKAQGPNHWTAREIPVSSSRVSGTFGLPFPSSSLFFPPSPSPQVKARKHLSATPCHCHVGLRVSVWVGWLGCPGCWLSLPQLFLSPFIRPVHQFLPCLLIREALQGEVQLRGESVTFNTDDKSSRSLSSYCMHGTVLRTPYV